MGSPGTVDIDNPAFPVHLIKAWHAQATFLVPYTRFLDWRKEFPIALLADKYDSFLPDQYLPSLVDGNVQLTFFYVNHLSSDLGSYFHAGILVRVVPASISHALPGYYIGLEVVDQGFTWIAGYRIWGYAKVLGKIDVSGSVPNEDKELRVTVTLPKQQPDRDKEGPSYRFDPRTCTERIFTLTIPRPDGSVYPYERDVYSHTLHGPKTASVKFPCETRFRRSSIDERVQPRSQGVTIQFHAESTYGAWLAKLPIADVPWPEVRWAARMSGQWSKWSKVG
jgi:hypothetical protein